MPRALAAPGRRALGHPLGGYVANSPSSGRGTHENSPARCISRRPPQALRAPERMSDRPVEWQLEAMGFSADLSKRAVDRGGPSLQGALDWLVTAVSPRR